MTHNPRFSIVRLIIPLGIIALLLLFVVNCWLIFFRTVPVPPPVHSSNPIPLPPIKADTNFPPDRTITLYIDNVPGDMGGFFIKRLKQLTVFRGYGSSTSGQYSTIRISSAADPADLAAKINFGDVQSVDAAARTLHVQADPKRLPPPLLPEVSVASDPSFYPRNFADLSSWDDHRRAVALTHLAAAPPLVSHDEISKSIEQLLQDPDPEVRRSAIHAFAIWGDKDRALTLLPLADDADNSTQDEAIKILGKIGDVRAAPRLAELLESSNTAYYAKDALIALGSRAEPALLNHLQVGSDHAQRLAIDILAAIGTSQSLPVLTAISTKDYGPTHLAARHAITAIQSRATPAPTQENP